MSKNNRCPARRALALLLTLALALSLAGCLTTEPVPTGESFQLRVVMIDVGQGDSILLSSGGQHMLVDAGENDMGGEVVAELRRLGVGRLAAVVGTHPHSDHIGGLDTVLRAIPADAVYLPRLTANTETYEDLLDAVDAAGLTVTVPEPGDRLTLGQAEIVFLWPPADYESDNSNNHSIVILVSAGGRGVLLCGDIEKKAEKGLLESGADIGCDVLKVAHHGSDTSSTADFLLAAHPSHALISVGDGNQFGHPDPDVLGRLQDAGAAVWRTDIDGVVTVTVVEGELHVAGGYDD